MLRQLSPSCPSLIINRLVYELPTTRDFHYKKGKRKTAIFFFFNFFLCPGQRTPSHFALLASICCHFSFPLLLSLQTHSSFSTSSFPHSSLIPLHPSLRCFCLVPVSTTAQSMNVPSESSQYFCVSLEAQVSVDSVVNELLLQAGGLCKCLCSGKPGQFVQ